MRSISRVTANNWIFVVRRLVNTYGHLRNGDIMRHVASRSRVGIRPPVSGLLELSLLRCMPAQERRATQRFIAASDMMSLIDLASVRGMALTREQYEWLGELEVQAQRQLWCMAVAAADTAVPGVGAGDMPEYVRRKRVPASE